MERDRFYEEVRAFIHRLAPEREGTLEIDENANLFDLRLVNSFSMVRLLMHVEQLVGTPVDVTQHEPESFFTLRGMYDSLVSPVTR